MMRVCHLNTCRSASPRRIRAAEEFHGQGGIHRQFFPVHRAGSPRVHGGARFRTVDEMIGTRGRLNVRNAVNHWKARGLDFSAILHQPDVPAGAARGVRGPQESWSRARGRPRDHRPLRRRARARDGGVAEPAHRQRAPDGRHDARLRGYAPARRARLPDDTIRLQFTGIGGPELRRLRAARQSRCASRATRTITSGRGCRAARSSSIRRGRRRSCRKRTFSSQRRAVRRERAARRTSAASPAKGLRSATAGAHAVVEGVGDHGCEYMTAAA